MMLVLFVSIIEVVIDPVLVEPSVDGLRLDTADRQETSARSSRDAHGKHALEQGFTLTTARIGIKLSVKLLSKSTL